MKKLLFLFSRIIVIALGVGVFAFLLWEPRVEGRNVNATNFEIYFTDPFLAFVYVGSIPFFVALFYVVKIIQMAEKGLIISQEVVRALRVIQYCALSVFGFIAVGMLIIVQNHGDDDPAGAIAIGFILSFIFLVATAASNKFKKSILSKLPD